MRRREGALGMLGVDASRHILGGMLGLMRFLTQSIVGAEVPRSSAGVGEEGKKITRTLQLGKNATSIRLM